MKFNKDKFVCESVFAYASTDFFASVKKSEVYVTNKRTEFNT